MKYALIMSSLLSVLLPSQRLAWLLLFVSTFVAAADSQPEKPFIHPMFSSHMVLQQGEDIVLWGWATPQSKVEVEFAGQHTETVAIESGRWELKLNPIAAGGPYQLNLLGEKRITLTDIYVGEVWLCSGQSNMFWPVAKAQSAKQALASANNKLLRLYTVAPQLAAQPQELFKIPANWRLVSPDSLKDFSAVCYFFGLELQQTLAVPVGVIHGSWGGTKIEAWTSRKTAQQQVYFKSKLQALELYAKNKEAAHLAWEREIELWWQNNDSGSKPANQWSKNEFDDSTWPSMVVPGLWTNNGLASFDGSLWLRKSVFLQDVNAESVYQLDLARIDDTDTTWVNGVLVGKSDKYDQDRRYLLPAGVLINGWNQIAMRIFDKGGDGGIYGSPADVRIVSDHKPATSLISLAGLWRYQVGGQLTQMAPKPVPILHKNTATVLFNAMIAPLTTLKVRGIAWYQGEQNDDHPEFYQQQLTDFIQDWRNQFNHNLVFEIVQLANFNSKARAKNIQAWPRIREAQRLVARRDPNVGLTVTIDIGDGTNIHPRNKKDVGVRLAKSALSRQYGEDDIRGSGPSPDVVSYNNGLVTISYQYAVDGLLTKDKNAVQGFELCFSPNHCQSAQGIVEASSVTIDTGATEFQFIRYGWQDNPVLDLYNHAGLPAVPFQMAIDRKN